MEAVFSPFRENVCRDGAKKWRASSLNIAEAKETKFADGNGGRANRRKTFLERKLFLPHFNLGFSFHTWRQPANSLAVKKCIRKRRQITRLDERREFLQNDGPTVAKVAKMVNNLQQWRKLRNFSFLQPAI